MKPEPNVAVAALRGPLLRSVSRSFYLSIRLVPAKLRDPFALAYLLARATDTIADTAKLPSTERMRHLAGLARLIQEDQDVTAAASSLVQSFAPLQRNAAERALITQLPACLRWLASVDPADQSDIRRVLATINEGQALDVERFGDSSRVTALATATELDRYTYLVAGCVGEFWTRVCFRKLPGFSTRPESEMVELGIKYGKALQLINILRDAGDDLRSGRCYLPAQELLSLGVSPSEFARDPVRGEPVAREWRARAADGLAAGIEYACAIRSRRVRFATALPALIGAQTLALLREAGATSFARKVKVPRAEVRQILFHLLRNLASPRSIRRAFAQLSSRAAQTVEGPPPRSRDHAS